MCLERHVLAAQYVVLADPAALQRQQMALGHIVHMHQIEPGIDKGRHAPGRRFDDDPAGGRGLDVARTDRRGRRDDHRRQAFFR